jgi:hypothetical protein
METNLIIIPPDELRSMIMEEINKALADFKPTPNEPSIELLNVEESMQLLGIKSRSGFKTWCIDNKVFGKPVGKRKMFPKSQLVTAFRPIKS